MLRTQHHVQQESSASQYRTMAGAVGEQAVEQVTQTDLGIIGPRKRIWNGFTGSAIVLVFFV